MRESDVEGVAIRGGPESCVGVREGAGEALAGGRAGWVIEPRNKPFGVPTPFWKAEGHVGGSVSASCRWTLRGRRAWARALSSPCARTGRPDVCPCRCGGGAGREGNAEAVSP